jgi:acetylornithine deacetylase/succinyl-diaminopimelate desuccinylase-like protein
MLEAALAFARQQREDHLAGLIEWLRIPSISTLAEHTADVRRAAEFAAGILADMGMRQVEVRQTPGHPVVVAQWLEAESAPTLLIYGHFDVQPVDPLEQWERPPFEPVVDQNYVYARGASDDKGQAFAVLSALRAYLQTSGRLPVNVKVLLEGEEEVTSRNLFEYIRQYANELAADAVLIADQDMLDPEHPVVMWGVRGQLYTEVEVCGPARDLHSGTFGGSVDNPLNVLVRLLASLQDGSTRRILIPGFYDSVRELDDAQRQRIAQAPIDDSLGLKLTGAPALAGESGYSLAERVSVRPTIEFHGIAGGFVGDGSKTVIPSRVLAKVGMRLVPDQDPQRVASAFEAFLRQQCPPTVRMNVRVIGQAHPVQIDPSAPAIQAADAAYRRGFGHPPLYLRGGGSLPIVHEMIQSLSRDGTKIPVVMIGFGLPDDGAHSPNERFFLPNFYKGIDTVIHYLDLFRNLDLVQTTTS